MRIPKAFVLPAWLLGGLSSRSWRRAHPWSPPASGQPAAGKTLIMALDQSDVKTLDPGREFEFGAAFVCLNTYDTLVAHKSPKELNTFVPVPGHRVEGHPGRQGVHLQAPAEREARQRQPLHRRGREVQPDPAEDPEGQPRLDDGPPQGGRGRRSR